MSNAEGPRALGVHLRRLRHHAGLNQYRLAARAGTHWNYVGAIERGEVANPQLATISQLAAALDKSIAPIAASFISPRESDRLASRLTAATLPNRSFTGGGSAVAHALAALRQAWGRTQVDLAKRTGLHRSYIGALERHDRATRSVGIATVTRYLSGLPNQPPTVEWLADHISLAAQVFAGEVSPDKLLLRGTPRTCGDPSAARFVREGDAPLPSA